MLQKLFNNPAVILFYATDKQLEYEWVHLKKKLSMRAPDWLDKLNQNKIPDPHPLFNIISGDIEEWEAIKLKRISSICQTIRNDTLFCPYH